ncbi:hypothetical protein SAMN05216588_103180 [Pseudomonas flavescens]|uniref:Tetratricopeptide repeat-containing protein n=1 Tax=Phytopseudomonas flavescens TaxID=29435 RepID=A0A1G8AIR0_9GAMM|nr:hypothetical protein [Pseudomonas flavescens]SDH20767.1 hypothetical protein SAMN05216588_103180 [Pseudomonas flavescens]
MTSFPLRSAALAALVLLMAGCQSRQQAEPAPAPAAVAVAPSAQQQFDADLAGGRLAEAKTQFEALRQDGDPAAVLHAQRRLSEAYLQEGQKALESGDLDKAAKSLGHARNLMPKAPALTTGLDGAIGKAREAELSAVEQARQAGEQAQAARQEQLRLLRQAAEAQAAATRTADDTPGQDIAQLIDPTAKRSEVSLSMLDSRDEAALFERLDAVAADVVSFDRSVHIQVRSAEDLRRVTGLLEARVMKRDPTFKLILSHAVKPVQVPRLVLRSRNR